QAPQGADTERRLRRDRGRAGTRATAGNDRAPGYPERCENLSGKPRAKVSRRRAPCFGAWGRRRMRIGIERKVLAVLPLAAIMGAPAAVGQAPFPEGPGRDLLLQVCTQCHAPNRILEADATA